MPVTGEGGALRILRDLPPPVVVTPAAVVAGRDAINLDPSYGFWTGDHVYVRSTRGLPFDINQDGYADCPGGYGIFSAGSLPLNAWRTANPTIPFRLGFPAFDQTGRTVSAELWLHLDELDRASFYLTLADALDGDPAKRLELYAVDFRAMVLAMVGPTGYEAPLAACDAAVAVAAIPPGTQSLPLADLATYQGPVAGGPDDDRPWTAIAMLSRWVLNLSGREADSTGVGERFGEPVKALITGGGSLDFLIDLTHRDGWRDPTFLLQLMLMLEAGSRAHASFRLMPERDVGAAPADHRLPGGLYFDAQILITGYSPNTSSDQIVAGVANFVTIGRIRAISGQNAVAYPTP
jgi:hypothetical protein